MRTIKVASWSAGKVKLPPRRGLLGSDMLSAVDVVTIDYENEVLRLRARR